MALCVPGIGHPLVGFIAIVTMAPLSQRSYHSPVLARLWAPATERY